MWWIRLLNLYSWKLIWRVISQDVISQRCIDHAHYHGPNPSWNMHGDHVANLYPWNSEMFQFIDNQRKIFSCEKIFSQEGDILLIYNTLRNFKKKLIKPLCFSNIMYGDYSDSSRCRIRENVKNIRKKIITVNIMMVIHHHHYHQISRFTL